MNNRDEDLTPENVDERVEQLKRAQDELANAPAPLAHVVRDLQRVYDEESRIEHAWARISNRARSLESTTQQNVFENPSNQQSFQGEQKATRDPLPPLPGSFKGTPYGPFQQQRPPRRRGWRNLSLGLAAAIVLIAIFAWTITAVYHGPGTQAGSGGPVSVITNTPTIANPTMAPAVTPTATAQKTPTPATQPTQQPTVQATSTPTQPAWKTYRGEAFTIQYPADWTASIIPSGGSGGLYTQQVEFRASSASPISFMVSTMYNGEMLPDTMLQNDTLYKSCKIDSQDKETVGGILWSTAIMETQGTQLAPAKIKLAYANHIHPYRISFSTPPAQFTANYSMLNTMFQSFHEA